MKKFEKELEFFQKKRTDLLKKHEGKFVVIVGEEVVDAYDDEWEAVEKARSVHNKELGKFLVKKVTPEDDIIFAGRITVND